MFKCLFVYNLFLCLFGVCVYNFSKVCKVVIFDLMVVCGVMYVLMLLEVVKKKVNLIGCDVDLCCVILFNSICWRKLCVCILVEELLCCMCSEFVMDVDYISGDFSDNRWVNL